MINYKALEQHFHTSPSAHKKLIDALLNNQNRHPCFILGRNEHAQKLLSFIHIDGVVDDFSSDAYWQGKKLIHSNNIPEGSIVINCSMSISPISAEKKILTINHVIAIPYSDFYKKPTSLEIFPNFVTQARSDFQFYSDKYKDIFLKLSDDESKSIFNSVISYRLTGDYTYMNRFTVRLRDQYFEPFIGDLHNVTFIDCGGYDGDTTEEFIKRYPEYLEVYLFEPSTCNLNRAKERLHSKKNIKFIPLGVSDTSGTLLFDESSGSASSISSAGSTQIQVTTLDEYIQQQALTFIKMDLEGWEMQALTGAREHIKNVNPILAIAVYHDISDFWKIPEYILSIQPNYKIYLRHYTEGWSETVMYFVPQSH